MNRLNGWNGAWHHVARAHLPLKNFSNSTHACHVSLNDWGDSVYREIPMPASSFWRHNNSLTLRIPVIFTLPPSSHREGERERGEETENEEGGDGYFTATVALCTHILIRWGNFRPSATSLHCNQVPSLSLSLYCRTSRCSNAKVEFLGFCRGEIQGSNWWI